MLKFFIEQKDFDELGEVVQALYTKGDDGKYQLQIEENPRVKELDGKVVEFRNNNIALQKQIEEVQSKMKGVDPDKYKEMEEKLQILNDKKLLEDGDIEKLLSERTDRMKKEFENQVNTLQEANDILKTTLDTSESRLSKVLIDSSIRDAVNGVGLVRQGAMVDIVSRGRETWKLQEGSPVPLKEDGTILYGSDAKTPMTFVEWATALVESAPFLFEPNDGAGSKGGGTGGGAGGGAGGGVSDDIKSLPASERLKRIHMAAAAEK